MNLKLKDNIILAAGFCDFTNELKEGEIQVECDGIILENISTHYQYTDGQLVERETPLTEEEVKIVTMNQEELLILLNKQLQDYIYNKYDTGTQLSIQAIYSDPNTSTETKTAIEGLWSWIKTVLAHYYVAKAALTDGDSWYEIDWNLSQFDATDPGMALVNLIG